MILPAPAYVPKGSVFKHSYKGKFQHTNLGSEFIHRSQQCVLLQACPSSVDLALRWEVGRSKEPGSLTHPLECEGVSCSCTDAAPFALIGLRFLTLGMRYQEGLEVGITQHPQKGESVKARSGPEATSQ